MVSVDKQTMINWSSVFCCFVFFVAFYSVVQKLNAFSVDELNFYPNFLYVYGLQLVSFQLFGLCMLLLLYAKQDQMISTLYNAWKDS
jgi:hypothetical protein